MVKAEIEPLLAELGFVRSAKSYAVPPDDGPHRPAWVRTRGGYVDEINLAFSKKGGLPFFLGFWTDQTERMLKDPRREQSHKGLVDVYAWLMTRPDPPTPRWRQLLNLIFLPFYGLFLLFFRTNRTPIEFGRGKGVDEAIVLAKARLRELDAYLTSGTPTPHLYLIADVLIRRGDPSEARPIPPKSLEPEPPRDEPMILPPQAKTADIGVSAEHGHEGGAASGD